MQYNPSLKVLDMENLQALLSIIVKVSLPLVDVLEMRQELLARTLEMLEKNGYSNSTLQRHE